MWRIRVDGMRVEECVKMIVDVMKIEKHGEMRIDCLRIRKCRRIEKDEHGRIMIEKHREIRIRERE